jgi:hypothetical protein
MFFNLSCEMENIYRAWSSLAQHQELKEYGDLNPFLVVTEEKEKKHHEIFLREPPTEH